MKKSTTFLTLAGVLALTGCTTKVMDDRYYETPRDDAGKPIQVDSVANPRPMLIEPEKVPLQNKKGGSAYDPMEVRELDKVGLGDNSASCPKGKRQPKGKGKGKAIKAAGTTVAPAGFYIVKRNDTLSKIAQKHRVSLAALLKANNLTKANAHRLQIGQKLVIPQAQGKKNPAPQQKKKGKKIATGTATVAASGNRNADGTYTVQSGDNIPKIARKLGVGPRTLQKANNLSDEATRKLRIGQKLVIPVGDKATTQKSVAQPKPQQQTPASQLPPAENTTTVTGTPDTTQTQQLTTTNTQQTSGVAPDSGVNSGEASTDFVPVGDAKTLEEVAAKHGTTVEKLRQLNASYANTDKLEPGSYIFVPRK